MNSYNDERTRSGWFWDTNKVFDSEDLSAYAMLVRLYLARMADGNGKSFPSTTTIAKKCKIGRATVFRALNELESKGWLRRTPRLVPGKENVLTSNIYSLVMPDETAASKEQYPSHTETTLVSERDYPSIRERLPPSHTETTLVSERDGEGLPIEVLPNKGLPIEEDTSPCGDLAQEIIDHFNEVWSDIHPKGYKLTKGRRSKIKARLKTFSVADIKQAIDNLHKSKWHRGDNDRGWKADIDFIIRNDEQIDKWCNNPPVGRGKRYDPEQVDWDKLYEDVSMPDW